MMDALEQKATFMKIFKETAANNMGLIHGFPNWANKIDFSFEGDDLLIKIPPLLIVKGTYERISKSKRKAEVDDFMRANEYTYLEYIIKMSCNIFAAVLGGGKVATVGGFYKRKK